MEIFNATVASLFQEYEKTSRFKNLKKLNILF